MFAFLFYLHLHFSLRFMFIMQHFQLRFRFYLFCDVKIKAEGQNAIISDVKIKIRYHGWVMTVKKMPKRAGHIS